MSDTTKKCGHCRGKRKIIDPGADKLTWITCPTCNGSGEAPPQREPEPRPAPKRKTSPAVEPEAEPARGELTEQQARVLRFMARLLKSPEVLQVLAAQPEIRVKVERQVIEVGSDSLRGRLALLIRAGFFDQGVTAGGIRKELDRRGYEVADGTLYAELKALAAMGFVFIEEGNKKEKKAMQFVAAPEMKANVKEK